MPDAGASTRGLLRVVEDLHGRDVAAAVYGPDIRGHALLRLNREILHGDDFGRVLSWARRELASGAPAEWLLADELADLA